jgi:hypothetical protein
MGRTGAFTSDLKDRWGVHWTAWPGASALVAQLARDLNRLADDPRVRLEADTAGGQLHIRAEVVDDDGRAQTFRRLTAHVAGPDGIAHDVALEPVGAGAYATTIPLSRPGTYVVTARDEIKKENVSTTGAVLTAGEELRPTGTDRALLARISSITDGKSRDTLAGIFQDRSALRFAYWSLTPWLVAFGSLFLLMSVAARRLSMPAFVAAIPGKVRSAFRRKPKARPVVAQDPAETLDRLGKAKEKVRAAGPSPLEAPLGSPQRPPPIAARRAPPVGTQVATPTRAQPAAAAPRMSVPGGPPSSVARPLTAAEILLQKRRGQRL